MAKVNLITVAMVCGLLVCVLDCSVGVVGAIRADLGGGLTLGKPYSQATHNRNGHLSVLFAAIVLIIMCIAAFFGELSIGPLRVYFKWFKSYFVRACYYLMMALLCLGLAGDLGFAAMIITAIYVIFLFIIGICLRKRPTKNESNA